MDSTATAAPRILQAPARLTAILAAAAIAVAALTGCEQKDCGAAPALGTQNFGARSADPALGAAPEGARPRPKPKPSKSTKPCPPKKDAKNGPGGKQNKDNNMFGANGTQISSRTLHRGSVPGYRYRVDV